MSSQRSHTVNYDEQFTDEDQLRDAGRASTICLPPTMGNTAFHINRPMLHLISLNEMTLWRKRSRRSTQSSQKLYWYVLFFNFENIRQESIHMRLFSFSLTGEFTTWLAEFTDGSITSCITCIFFPPSRMLQLSDVITNFHQNVGEPLHEAWLHFRK